MWFSRTIYRSCGSPGPGLEPVRAFWGLKPPDLVLHTQSCQKLDLRQKLCKQKLCLYCQRHHLRKILKLGEWASQAGRGEPFLAFPSTSQSVYWTVLAVTKAASPNSVAGSGIPCAFLPLHTCTLPPPQPPASHSNASLQVGTSCFRSPLGPPFRWGQEVRGLSLSSFARSALPICCTPGEISASASAGT